MDCIASGTVNLWAEPSVWLETKQAKPLNTLKNLKAHDSDMPLKPFRATSDTTQKHFFLGRGSERSGSNHEAESQHHWFSIRNKQKKSNTLSLMNCLRVFFLNKEVQMTDRLTRLLYSGLDCQDLLYRLWARLLIQRPLLAKVTIYIQK